MTSSKSRHRPRRYHRGSVSDRARQAMESISRSLQAGPLGIDEVERIVASFETTTKRVWGLLGRRFNKRLRVEKTKGVERWTLER